jgi:protein-disulfide isomerase
MSSSPDSELTRKQRREQAREQRKAMEQAQAAGAARRKRLIQLGAVVAVVAIAIAIILIATGGSKKKGIVSGKEENQTVSAVTTLLAGIPQSGNTLGSPTAPVTMQYFGDLQCPFCREFTLGALPYLIQKYVRTDKLKVQYRSFETASRADPEIFQKQQVAALAAGKQRLMWDYVELFYQEQGEEGSGYVTEAFLKKLARQVPGLNLASWNSAREDPRLTAIVSADHREAGEAGISSTPEFLVFRRGETPQVYEPTSITDPSGFEAAIDKRLR